jgi:hypothetical protein
MSRREQDGGGRLAGYVRDWLERRDGRPASDLDLVVLLVNSLDLLEDPPDRLTDLGWFRGVTDEVGRADISSELRAGDLTELRQLRESLRAVFLAPSPDNAPSRSWWYPLAAADFRSLRASRASRRWRHACPRPWPSMSRIGALAGWAPVPRCPASAPSSITLGPRPAGSAAQPAMIVRLRGSTASGSGRPSRIPQAPGCRSKLPGQLRQFLDGL